jgi:putative peptide zinc metalloprotease protein
VVRSGAGGRLVLDRADDLPGRFVRRGDALGYVVGNDASIIRAVVSQDDVDLVRTGLAAIDVRLAERQDRVYRAVLLREVPAAREELPSSALSSAGGGTIAADPRDPKGAKAIQSTFQFDLSVPDHLADVNYGGRAYVRFVLHAEPLSQRWYRRLRQVFLTRFHV